MPEMKFDSLVLVGVFEDRNEAELAADGLREAGFHDDQIGFAIRGSDAVEGGMITDSEGTKDAKGAIEGAVGGAAIGAGLGALVALFIPGAGPVLAAGILATALGYGAAGAAVGGIYGAMVGLGVSEEEAVCYEHEFKSGKAIVAVRPGAAMNIAAAILHRHGGYNLHQEPQSPVPLTGPTDV